MENLKNPALHDEEVSAELVGLLTAISIVSKRLARNLAAIQAQVEEANHG